MPFKLLRPKQGFTLIELLVVVVVLGILVAIAIPKFQDSQQNTKEKTAITNIRTAASQAAAKWANTGSVTGFNKPENVTYYSGARKLMTTTPAVCMAFIRSNGSFVPGKEPKCSPMYMTALGAILEDGPMGYWTLSQGSGLTINDESGNDNNGSAIGPPTYGANGPPVGEGLNSFRFDGVEDTLRVNSSTSLDFTNGVTIEAWVKVPDTASAFMVVDRAGQYRMRINGGKYACYFTTPSPTGTRSHQSTAIVDDNQWHHIACTYNGSQIKIYRDGQPHVSKNFASPASITPVIEDVYIGSFENNAQYYGGDIAQVAVFNKALSDARILAHYQG